MSRTFRFLLDHQEYPDQPARTNTPMRRGRTQIIKSNTALYCLSSRIPWMVSANASLYRNDVFQRIPPDQWFQVCRISLLAYFSIKKTVEKTSPRLLPVALGRVVCAHSQLWTVLSEYLWYPRNLNLRDVDRRADISHLKSGRRSVL